VVTDPPWISRPANSCCIRSTNRRGSSPERTAFSAFSRPVAPYTIE